MGKRKASLHVYAEYEVKVFNPKTGKVIKRVKGRCKTFTQHFSRILAICLFPRGDATVRLSITDYEGYGRIMKAPHDYYCPPQYPPATGYAFHLGVGRSDTAFSRDQWNLIDLIDWVPYSTYSITDTAVEVIIEVSGSWYNDTGVAQTVREIGMLGLFRDEGGT